MEAPGRAPDDADQAGSAERHHVPLTVFWQRRALVGIIAAALVVGLTIGFASWRNRTALADPGPALSASNQPGTASTPDPDPATAGPREATAAPNQAPVTCDVAQLVLRVSGPARVKAGDEASLVVTFTNIGSEGCILPLNAATFVLRITSGADEIWKSTDCDGWGPDSSTLLAPGQTLEWTKTWNRHRSDRCTVVADDLRPGTYVATATWRQGPTGRHVMTLTW